MALTNDKAAYHRGASVDVRDFVCAKAELATDESHEMLMDYDKLLLMDDESTAPNAI